MAKDPAFLLYSSDFLTGTIFMTNEETGVYIKLLCIQHQKGRINPQDFNRFCSGFLRVIEKFVSDELGYYNERLEDVILARSRGTNASRNNGKKGGRPSKNNTKNPQDKKSKPKNNLSEDENVNEINNRKSAFSENCKNSIKTSDEKLLGVFIAYWTEVSKNGKKMRFEGEKYFELQKRFATFERNQLNYIRTPEPQKLDLSTSNDYTAGFPSQTK